MEYVQGVKTNISGYDFAIGDIHGHYDELIQKLDHIGFNRKHDRLFCTGDLIDHGGKNKEVVQLIKEHWFFTVRGNHDQMIIDQFDDERVLLFNYEHETPQQVHSGMAGQWFSALSSMEQKWFYTQLSNLPYIIEVETRQGLMAICHAGVPEHFTYYQDFRHDLNERNTRELCLRSRRPHKIMRNLDDITITVHGHECFPHKHLRGNSVWIDTFGESGQFTVVELSDLMSQLTNAEPVHKLHL